MAKLGYVRCATVGQDTAVQRAKLSNDRNLWMVSGGVTSVGAPSRG